MGKRRSRLVARWWPLLLPIAVFTLAGQTGGTSAAARPGQFPAFIPMPGVAPRGVAVDQAGYVYVSIGETVAAGEYMKVWKFTPEGEKFPEPFADIGLGTFGGLMFSADGDLYVAMGGGAARGIWRVDAEGHKELLPNSNQIQFANGLAFDDHGTLYITETATIQSMGPPPVFGQGGIWRIPPGGQAALCLRDALLTGTKALNNPIPIGANGIAFFEDNLFVTNTEKSTVLRIPVTDGVVGTPEVWATLQEVPGSPLAGFPIPPMGDGLIVDVHGNPCVAVLTRAAVVRINASDRTQETIAAFPAHSIDFPASVWFAPGQGARRMNLFVTDLGMGIKFLPQAPWPGPGLARIDAGPIDHVSRPFMTEERGQMVVNLLNFSFMEESWGNATHLGLFTMTGSGTVAALGHGIITGANGDSIFFNYIPPASGTTVPAVITGGTGHFLGAGGEFTIVVEELGRVIDPIAMTMTISFIANGTGTISY